MRVTTGHTQVKRRIFNNGGADVNSGYESVFSIGYERGARFLELTQAPCGNTGSLPQASPVPLAGLKWGLDQAAQPRSETPAFRVLGHILVQFTKSLEVYLFSWSLHHMEMEDRKCA